MCLLDSFRGFPVLGLAVVKHALNFLSFLNFRIRYFKGKHTLIKGLSRSFVKNANLESYSVDTIHGFRFNVASKLCLDQVLWNCEPFTAKVMAELAPLIDSFIDVGANRGFYSLLLKSINPDISVIAFEPEKMVFKKLEENINLNSYDSIHCHNLALGERRTKKKLYTYSVGNDGMHTLTPVSFQDTTSQMVQVMPLDNFLLDSAYSLASILIKIDTEGSEDEVLLGASKLLQSSPILIIELNEHMRDESRSISLPRESSDSSRSSSKEVKRRSIAKLKINNLINTGYECFWIDEREHLVSVSSVNTLPHHSLLGEKHGANYLFIPKGFILPQKLSVLVN